MAHTILREGRKFDVAMWASSQYIENPKAVKVLSQAALQICFRPDDWSIDKTARRLTQSNPKQQMACKRELMRLQPGEFFFLHNGNPVRVDSNPEPGEVKPKPSAFVANDCEN